MTLKFMLGFAMYDLFRFGNSLARLRRFLLGWKTSNRPPQSEVVQQTSMAMRYARVWYPKRIRCLQRSAVLTGILRSHGVPAQVVLGSQKMPFKGHAWVEVDGKAINERRSVAIFDVWDRF
jgi:hypothetical protein